MMAIFKYIWEPNARDGKELFTINSKNREVQTGHEYI